MAHDTGPDYLFVYGTLMRSVKSVMTTFIKEYSHFVDDAYVIGDLYDVGHYPALTAGSHKVYGEVVQIMNPDRTFDVLDRYEGPQYRRIQLPAFLNNRPDPLIVWSYEFIDSTEGLPLIRSGSYPQYLKQKENSEL